MELGSLYSVLHNDTMELTGEMMYFMLRDLCSGMRYLHECKPAIVHGGELGCLGHSERERMIWNYVDLKSANCLVDAKWYVKVSDFGQATSRPSSSTGTLTWMAPGNWQVGSQCNHA